MSWTSHSKVSSETAPFKMSSEVVYAVVARGTLRASEELVTPAVLI